MKLFSLRLTTLKSKLYAIVFASIVVRVVAFFALPNIPSPFGPDEGTYGQAANWVALGKPATDFPGYGASLYVSGRSLLLPAAVFNKIGLSQLNSVRLVASLYGLLILCIVVSIILRTTCKHAQFSEKYNRAILSLFVVFAFTPSHFVWSILGLRESATEFWVISVFALLFLILQLREKITIVTTSGFTLSIIMVFSARPQVGWVLGVTLLLYLFFEIRNRAAKTLIPLTVVAIILGYVATAELNFEINPNYSVIKEISTPIQSVTPDNENINPPKSDSPMSSVISEEELSASKLCKHNRQIVTVNGHKFQCVQTLRDKENTNLRDIFGVLITQADVISVKHEVNKLGAASAIETSFCPIDGTSRLERYFCLAYRSPHTTFTFLFRPILGADITSSTSLFAAAENIFWLGAVSFVAVMLIRNRRLAFFGALAPSLLFLSIYSVTAGAYEGNMGTAFRHKSLILWVVLLLIASTIVATQQRKAEREGISGFS